MNRRPGSSLVRDPREQSVPPFSRFPNVVVRDPSVPPEVLVLVTYRSTFADPYTLREDIVCEKKHGRRKRSGICSGLSRDIYRRANTTAVALGLLRREQPRSRLPDGTFKFGYVEETLTLPNAKSGYRVVYRHWFEIEPRLGVKAMAAWLFIRAGTGRGKGVFLEEITGRFAWSKKTAQKVLRELSTRGLVIREALPKKGGRFGPSWYVDIAQTARSKIPATGTPGGGNNGHIHIVDRCTDSERPTIQAAVVPTPRSRRGKATPPESREEPPFDLAELTGIAYTDRRLLGWVSEDDLVAGLFSAVSPVAMDNLVAAASDCELQELLLEATHNRVSPDLLAPAGLTAVRLLATLLVRDGRDPRLAIEAVLDLVRERIGTQPGEWLNSLSLVGKRIAGAILGGRDVAYGSRPAFRPLTIELTNCDAGDVARAWEEVRAADQAEVINPAVYRDTNAFARLYDAHGQFAVDTVKLILQRGLIDGAVTINSWTYFERAIQDAAGKNVLAQCGLLRGDLLGKGPDPDDCPF